jgi:hypothetical protein
MSRHPPLPTSAARRPAIQLATLLAVLALMVQAFVPTGYMVRGAGHSGGIEITLCTANGSIGAIMAPDGQIIAKEDGEQSPPDHNPTDQPLCGFAAHNGAVLGAFAAPLNLQLAFSAPDSIVVSSAHVAPGLGLAAPPPPKTGPPIQA